MNQRVKIPEEVAYQKIGEEIVLLHLKNGIYYGLDAIGTRIWELLCQQRTLQSVLEAVAQDHDVASEKLEQDIRRLVAELQTNELVEVVD